MSVVIEIISEVLISIRDPKPYQQKTNRFSLEPLAFYLIPPYFYLKPYFFNRDTLRCLLKVPFHLFYNILQRRPATKENRIYIRVEFRILWYEFVSPFQSEREFKVYKSCKCSQIICSRVHYYSMFPRLSISISNFVKLLNKLYKMN